MSRGCQVQAGKATGVRHVARVFSADCGRRCGCCIDRTSLRKAELQLKRCTWSASRLATCAAQMRGGTEPNRTREVAVRGTAARTQSSHKFGGASAAFDWSRVHVAWRETNRQSSGLSVVLPDAHRSHPNVKWTTLCTYTNSWVRPMRRRGRGGGGWEVLVV